MGQQPTPAVGVVPGAERNACHFRKDRRLNGVLEQDRAIEFKIPQLSGQPDLSGDACMTSRFLKGNDLVHIRTKTIEFGHPGLRENGDPRPRPGFPDRADGRERHDDISDPVRSPDQQPFNPLPGESFPPSHL